MKYVVADHLSTLMVSGSIKQKAAIAAADTRTGRLHAAHLTRVPGSLPPKRFHSTATPAASAHQATDIHSGDRPARGTYLQTKSTFTAA